MSLALSRPSRKFLPDRSQEAEDALLRHGLEQATQTKQALRDALHHVSPRPRVTSASTGKRRKAPTVARVAKGATDAARPEDLIKDINCNVHFNTYTGLTTMMCSASIKHTKRELALILDPRSWSGLGDVIGAAYLVKRDAQGQYSPAVLTKTGELKLQDAENSPLHSLPLGEPWKNQLLFEYAHSEVASFENILCIEEFQVSSSLIKAEYQLFECLSCTFGFFSAPGGLTMNQGFVKAKPLPGRGNKGWWSIEVKKVVQVRDLTPQDPGNKYDFGELVNSTIGGALTQWVREAASALSPVS